MQLNLRFGIWTLFATFTAVSVLAFAGCRAGDKETSGPSGVTATIDVLMSDSFFVPDDITVQARSEITFVLENIGDLPHNMNIATSGSFSDLVSEEDLILAGQTGELVWAVPGETGTYDFRCDIHPIEMVGFIRVE